MFIFEIFTKEKSKQKDITLSKFIEEYQKITLTFLREIKQLTQNNQNQIMHKLITMYECTSMSAYTSDMVRQDVLELLNMNQIDRMFVKEMDVFDPNNHDCRHCLDLSNNYVIIKVYEDGFIRNDEVIKKAIVEVREENKHE